MSFFAFEGMILDGVMDSSVFDAGVMWCGNSAPDTSPASDNRRYGVTVTTTGDTNANALRFVGLLIETERVKWCV